MNTPPNNFLVGAEGDKTAVLLHPSLGAGITKEQVLNLAAYMLACSGQDLDDLRPVYEAVLS